MKKNAIIFACDKNFLFTFSVALMSIKKYSYSTLENADVILYYYGLEKSDIEFINKIHSVMCIEYEFPYNINQNDENFKKYTQLAYARYEAFTLIEQYKKVLYLDVDILVTSNLDYIFNNFCNNTGLAFAADEQKGLCNVKKNFKNTIPNYDMDIKGLNSGVILFSNVLKNGKELKEWCYQKTVEWLDNLICPDQGVLNIMIQHFNINMDIMPDICNCMVSNHKYMDKRYRNKVIVYHCAGGGVRFWRYSYYSRWEELYYQYLSLGGMPYKVKEKPWRVFLKKYKLYKFDFFDESPNPNTHTGKFIKYIFTYIMYKIFGEKK